MQAHYIEAHHFSGIPGLQDGAEEALIWKSGQSSAVLTKDTDTSFDLADRVVAAGHGLLTGLFGGAKGSPESQIERAVEDIRSERAKTYTGGMFLIFQTSQTVDDFDYTSAKDAGEFLIGFDLIDSPSMKLEFARMAQKSLAAVSILTSQTADPHIRKVASAIYFTGGSAGKPIFTYTLTGFAPSLYMNPLLDEASIGEGQKLTDAIGADKGAERATDLYIHSLTQGRASFRAFLSAWSSFEIFVNQTFKASYWPEWVKHLEKASPPSASKYFQRVGEVMSDKHRLIDKFIVIASLLAPTDAEADIAQAAKLKKVRDELVHTTAGNDSFPSDEIQRLVRKYLRLHLESVR